MGHLERDDGTTMPIGVHLDASQGVHDEHWTLSEAEPDLHRHRYSGQSLEHTHENGRLRHGYYQHPEDPPTATVQPRTRIWVAIDFAADGPDATVFVEELLSQDGNIVGWHVVNPANETDKAEFNAVGDDLSRVFEDEGPMESMFTDEVPDGT